MLFLEIKTKKKETMKKNLVRNAMVITVTMFASLLIFHGLSWNQEYQERQEKTTPKKVVKRLETIAPLGSQMVRIAIITYDDDTSEWYLPCRREYDLQVGDTAYR